MQGEDGSDESFKPLLKMPIADFWLDLAEDVKARITHQLENAPRDAVRPARGNVLLFRKPG